MKITTEEQLRKLYGWPKGRTKSKVLSELEKHSINFIVKSPFFVLSTCNSLGQVDASPRGGDPGFVRILDSKTLLVPDSKGNKRVDSLVNIIDKKGVGCLFFIPGIDETLRINGNAVISVASKHLAMFDSMQNKPISCLKVSITEVFLHCAKAFMRSRLWEDDNTIKKSEFPTIGQMLNDQLGMNNTPESREEMIERYLKDL